MAAPHPFVCPSCRIPLASVDGGLKCRDCGSDYSIRDRIADFSGGHYYDSFSGPEVLDDNARAGLEAEIGGSIRRMSGFYADFLRQLGARSVLDCGAGNGEGLSRVLANDIYPGAEPSNFVSSASWLDAPRAP